MTEVRAHLRKGRPVRAHVRIARENEITDYDRTRANGERKRRGAVWYVNSPAFNPRDDAIYIVYQHPEAYGVTPDVAATWLLKHEELHRALKRLKMPKAMIDLDQIATYSSTYHNDSPGF